MKKTAVLGALFNIPVHPYQTEEAVVKKNENFSTLLLARGVPQQSIHYASQTCREVFDMRK